MLAYRKPAGTLITFLLAITTLLLVSPLWEAHANISFPDAKSRAVYEKINAKIAKLQRERRIKIKRIKAKRYSRDIEKKKLERLNYKINRAIQKYKNKGNAYFRKRGLPEPWHRFHAAHAEKKKKEPAVSAASSKMKSGAESVVAASLMKRLHDETVKQTANEGEKTAPEPLYSMPEAPNVPASDLENQKNLRDLTVKSAESASEIKPALGPVKQDFEVSAHPVDEHAERPLSMNTSGSSWKIFGSSGI